MIHPIFPNVKKLKRKSLNSIHMIKIAILIPSTSKGLNCKDYRDTHFYRIFFKSFYNTISKKHKYTIYLEF